MPNAGAFKKGEKRPNQGRPPGMPNKNTALIREMVAQALDQAGGVDYLVSVAQSNPGPFLALVGKVLPVQLQNADDQPFRTLTRIELVPMADDAKD